MQTIAQSTHIVEFQRNGFPVSGITVQRSAVVCLPAVVDNYGFHAVLHRFGTFLYYIFGSNFLKIRIPCRIHRHKRRLGRSRNIAAGRRTPFRRLHNGLVKRNFAQVLANQRFVSGHRIGNIIKENQLRFRLFLFEQHFHSYRNRRFDIHNSRKRTVFSVFGYCLYKRHPRSKTGAKLFVSAVADMTIAPRRIPHRIYSGSLSLP